jgi:hypothetical protein
LPKIFFYIILLKALSNCQNGRQKEGESLESRALVFLRPAIYQTLTNLGYRPTGQTLDARHAPFKAKELLAKSANLSAIEEFIHLVAQEQSMLGKTFPERFHLYWRTIEVMRFYFRSIKEDVLHPN